jgi:glyoxylase-like metal-dependent hydrolase (beta-lactamase superfamily II)
MAAVPAPLETVRVGDIRLTWVPDGEGIFSATGFLTPSTDDEWRSRHSDHIDADVKMVVSLGGMLVQTPSSNVLVDVGIGAHRFDTPIGYSAGGEFLNSLARTGVTPEQIDAIVFTHLHLDHVGWTGEEGDQGYRLRFPNARIVMHPDEWSFWEGKDDHIGMPLESMEKPIVERGALELLSGDREIVPGLNLVHTPGHTPGHASVVVTSGDERVYVLGDVFHSPAQVEDTWVCFADTHPDAMRSTREAILKELQLPGTLTAGTHFPNTIFGRVVPVERKLHWVMGAGDARVAT